MTDDILLTIGEDGKASLYDDTFDITIHCETKEEQDEVKRVLQDIPHWIPVTENCDCDKMDKCEKLQLPPASCSEFPNNSDTISRQAAIDTITAYPHGDVWNVENMENMVYEIKNLPSAQPEITHEQAVAYLQSTGWMQEHDLQMMLDGVHRLTVQPEIVRCKDCKHHWTHKCMDSMPIERCDLEQTFYDAEIDFCSLAEKREVTT